MTLVQYLSIMCFGSLSFLVCLQCWMVLVGQQEGHLPVKKLSDGILAWLSVGGEVQICIWPS